MGLKAAMTLAEETRSMVIETLEEEEKGTEALESIEVLRCAIDLFTHASPTKLDGVLTVKGQLLLAQCLVRVCVKKRGAQRQTFRHWIK